MFLEKNFIANLSSTSIEKGSFEWSAPSNIALVKYWGKKENQIPANPSISFTLNNCKTTTKVDFKKTIDGNFTFDILYEGEYKKEFVPKINHFFLRIEKYCSYINDYHFTIDTSNTFPHSSGIEFRKATIS
jgi:diphosphomevalonate decarboxylase